MPVFSGVVFAGDMLFLLAYLKFCWRVLFFAGVVLGPKRGVLLAYASKILLAVRQKIPALRFGGGGTRCGLLVLSVLFFIAYVEPKLFFWLSRGKILECSPYLDPKQRTVGKQFLFG